MRKTVLNSINADQDLMNRLMIEYRRNTSSIVDIDEFQADLTRVMYVSRILRRYHNSGALNVKLLLNHVIILYNCFDTLATEALIQYVSEDVYSELFAVMDFISRLPDQYLHHEKNQTIIQRLEQEIER